MLAEIQKTSEGVEGRETETSRSKWSGRVKSKKYIGEGEGLGKCKGVSRQIQEENRSKSKVIRGAE